MKSLAQDTIFAVATGAGRAAVALMRLSGPQSGRLLAKLCRQLPAPRHASLRRLRGPDGEVLDQALVLYMPGPGSYTGEDMAELFLHGGRAVIAGVAEALAGFGARPAEPGEFTRRAFLNGRMDLLEAEAVGDLIEAETDAQRRQALRQMEGSLGTIYRDWADRLRRLLAHQEALIDFPDEALPMAIEQGTTTEIAALGREIAEHLRDGRRGERLREGLIFAVTGPPNVGKSSLVNALADREVAIVAALPGTTRDVLEARVVLDGVPVTLVDTAGLRDTEDPVEAEGVRRARQRAADADLVLHMSAGGSQEPETSPQTASLPIVNSQTTNLHIVNKVDLGGVVPAWALGISALTGEGLDRLRGRLAQEARRMTESQGPPPLTRTRHRAALTEALSRLQAAGAAVFPELRAEDLRLALRATGRITGEVGVEDLLGDIFARFCIGK